jgi:hypothetical protein
MLDGIARQLHHTTVATEQEATTRLRKLAEDNEEWVGHIKCCIGDDEEFNYNG